MDKASNITPFVPARVTSNQAPRITPTSRSRSRSGWRGSASKPTPPKKAVDLLPHRLKALLGQEPDLIAEAQSQLITHTNPEIRELAKRCELPYDLIPLEHHTTLITNYDPNHPSLSPLKTLITDLKALATIHPCKPLTLLLNTYQSFLHKLATTKDRALLFTPKARVTGDTIGFYLLDLDIARRLLTIDPFNFPVRENQHGSHRVTAIGGVHCKPNPISAFASTNNAIGQVEQIAICAIDGASQGRLNESVSKLMNATKAPA